MLDVNFPSVYHKIFMLFLSEAEILRALLIQQLYETQVFATSYYGPRYVHQVLTHYHNFGYVFTIEPALGDQLCI
jgi:hypothetical protein